LGKKRVDSRGIAPIVKGKKKKENLRKKSLILAQDER
jgi:hypothetical protein